MNFKVFRFRDLRGAVDVNINRASGLKKAQENVISPERRQVPED